MIANSPQYKNGRNDHPYYACQTKCNINGDYCRGIRVPKKKIEDFIEAFIGSFAESEFSKATVNEPEVVNRIEVELNHHRANLEKLKRKQAALTSKFLDSDNSSVEVLIKANDECKLKISKEEKDIRILEQQLSDLNHEDAAKAFGVLKKWKSLDIHTKRVALHKVLPKAVMFEEPPGHSAIRKTD
jgi:hypothetical protein